MGAGYGVCEFSHPYTVVTAWDYRDFPTPLSLCRASISMHALPWIPRVGSPSSGPCLVWFPLDGPHSKESNCCSNQNLSSPPLLDRDRDCSVEPPSRFYLASHVNVFLLPNEFFLQKRHQLILVAPSPTA